MKHASGFLAVTGQLSISTLTLVCICVFALLQERNACLNFAGVSKVPIHEDNTATRNPADPEQLNEVPLVSVLPFYIAMYRKRNIYLDPELAREAVGTKESTEALAVVLGIKVAFVNSVVTDASATRLMHILHIGHARYKRAGGHAIRKGWLLREGGNLRALKIKALDSYNVRLVFTKYYYYNDKRSADVSYPYTLTQLCNFIRQAVLLFHISKQAVVYDTTHPGTHTLQSKHRAAKRRVMKWRMREPMLKEKADRFSYIRMAAIAGCSKSKAKSLVRALVEAGVIARAENYERTHLHIDDYSKTLRDAYAASGAGGFLVRHDGKVMLRLANSYSLNKCVVRFITGNNVNGKNT